MMAKKRRGQKSLFFPAKHKKYARIVKLTSVSDAIKACRRLMREFNQAKTKAKKRRIIQVCNLAANRATAMAKNPRISKRKREELKNIADIYRMFQKRLSWAYEKGTRAR